MRHDSFQRSEVAYDKPCLHVWIRTTFFARHELGLSLSYSFISTLRYDYNILCCNLSVFLHNCLAGHYKHHPEEYRAAVTELLTKASMLYMSRRQLNSYDLGTSEHSDMLVSDVHKAGTNSNNRLRRAPDDPIDHFLLPSSMEYHESSNEEPKPELFNMPSVESINNPHGVLGQMLYDVCVPKNVEGWDFKPSASINGRHINSIARQHGTFNPIKCIRRSKL